jgi:hypothetical protein
VIVLDENILDDQRFLLVLLRRHRKITFFTRDADFYLPALRHSSYCLVVLAVGQNEVAAFVRRFLSQPDSMLG